MCGKKGSNLYVVTLGTSVAILDFVSSTDLQFSVYIQLVSCKL